MLINNDNEYIPKVDEEYDQWGHAERCVHIKEKKLIIKQSSGSLSMWIDDEYVWDNFFGEIINSMILQGFLGKTYMFIKTVTNIREGHFLEIQEFFYVKGNQLICDKTFFTSKNGSTQRLRKIKNDN